MHTSNQANCSSARVITMHDGAYKRSEGIGLGSRNEVAAGAVTLMLGIAMTGLPLLTLGCDGSPRAFISGTYKGRVSSLMVSGHKKRELSNTAVVKVTNSSITLDDLRCKKGESHSIRFWDGSQCVREVMRVDKHSPTHMTITWAESVYDRGRKVASGRGTATIFQLKSDIITINTHYEGWQVTGRLETTSSGELHRID